MNSTSAGCRSRHWRYEGCGLVDKTAARLLPTGSTASNKVLTDLSTDSSGITYRAAHTVQIDGATSLEGPLQHQYQLSSDLRRRRRQHENARVSVSPMPPA